MLQRLKCLVYDCILWIASLQKGKHRERTLLVVKTDEIGDYILWRNFIPAIANSERFKGYAITLCGNAAWKGITNTFDNTFFTDTIWLDKKKFKSDMRYRYRFLKSINRQRFETVINPIFSRCKRVDDAIVIAATASARIGMRSNSNNVLPFEAGYDKGLYTTIIDLPLQNYFDFYRNRDFINAMLDNTEEAPVLSCTDNLPDKQTGLPEHYFVIFPGSGNPARKWSSVHFAEVAAFLTAKTGGTAVVCGAPGDAADAGAFTRAYTGKVIDLCGRTSLPEFMAILRAAKCLVSIDTGAVHMAAAVQCPVFGIFNGSQYGRFAPYPAAVFPYFFAIYPTVVMEDIQNGIPGNKYDLVVDIDYNFVAPGMVTDSILQSGILTS